MVNQSHAGAGLQKVDLRIVLGCAAARQRFAGLPLFFFYFFNYFLDHFDIEGSYLSTIFQADRLTVMYSPQQELQNKGKA